MNDIKVTSQPDNSDRDSQQAETVTTWESLTPLQQKALHAIQDGVIFHDPYLKREIEVLGLVTRTFQHVWLTDLGKRVLASATGSPDSGKAAETFREGDTVSKVNSSPSDIHLDGEIGIITFVYDEYSAVLFMGAANDVLVPHDKLEVMYTTPQPAPASEPETAGSEVGQMDAYEKLVYQWRDTHLALSNELAIEFDPEGSDTRYVEAINVLKVAAENAQAELATVRQQLATADGEMQALKNRGSLIAWAIETAKVWRDFVNTSDDTEPPSEALSLTLNVLATKVTDYLRKEASQPKAADADEGGGS